MKLRLAIPAVVLLGVACQPAKQGEPDAGPTCTPPAFATPVAATAQAVIVTSAALQPAFAKLAALHTVDRPAHRGRHRGGDLRQPAPAARPTRRTTRSKAIKDALKRARRPEVRGARRRQSTSCPRGRCTTRTPTRWRRRTTSPPTSSPTTTTRTSRSGTPTATASTRRRAWTRRPTCRTWPVSRIPVHTSAEAATLPGEGGAPPHRLRRREGEDGAAAGQRGDRVQRHSTSTRRCTSRRPGRTRSLLPLDFALQRLYANITPPVRPDGRHYCVGERGGRAARRPEPRRALGPRRHRHADGGVRRHPGLHRRARPSRSPTAPADLPVVRLRGRRLQRRLQRRASDCCSRPTAAPSRTWATRRWAWASPAACRLIDELLRAVQAAPSPLLADAYLAAHQNLPAVRRLHGAAVRRPSPPVVDQSSCQWTQKGVVLLGDALIPVWKSAVPWGRRSRRHARRSARAPRSP